MSKITNDSLTRSGTGCFLAVPGHMATVGVKELNPVIEYSVLETLFAVTHHCLNGCFVLFSSDKCATVTPLSFGRK